MLDIFFYNFTIALCINLILNVLTFFIKADEAVNWFQKRLQNAVSYGLSTEDQKMFGNYDCATLF